MSPEQVRGMRVDTRSDIFALGAILYELMCYEKAFPGEMTAVFYKTAHESPRPLSDFLLIDPAPLQDIVDRSLATDEAMGLQTAYEMDELLGKAHPYSPPNYQTTA